MSVRVLYRSYVRASLAAEQRSVTYRRTQIVPDQDEAEAS